MKKINYNLYPLNEEHTTLDDFRVDKVDDRYKMLSPSGEGPDLPFRFYLCQHMEKAPDWTNNFKDLVILPEVEICDILSSDLDFFHIKKYRGGQSLSTLFRQGAVAMQTMLEIDGNGVRNFIREKIKQDDNYSGEFPKCESTLKRNAKLVYGIGLPSVPAPQQPGHDYTSKLVIYDHVKTQIYQG